MSFVVCFRCISVRKSHKFLFGPCSLKNLRKTLHHLSGFENFFPKGKKGSKKEPSASAADDVDPEKKVSNETKKTSTTAETNNDSSNPFAEGKQQQRNSSGGSGGGGGPNNGDPNSSHSQLGGLLAFAVTFYILSQLFGSDIGDATREVCVSIYCTR